MSVTRTLVLISAVLAIGCEAPGPPELQTTAGPPASDDSRPASTAVYETPKATAGVDLSTREVVARVNLDASVGARFEAFDSAAPNETSDFWITISPCDEGGAPIAMDLFFQRADDSIWHWYVLIDGGFVANGVPGDDVLLAGGDLEFDDGGFLASNPVFPVTAYLADEQVLEMDINFAGPLSDDGPPTSTAFVGPSTLLYSSRDGCTVN